MQIQHFIVLSMILDSDSFRELLNGVNEKSNEELYNGDDKYVDNSLESYGITVTYHDKTHKKKVKLLINPDKLLIGDDSDSNSISKWLSKLEKRINDYFDLKYTLNDFNLKRMGIITNINVHERSKAATYLKILQKLGKVKGYSPSKHYSLDNDISFNLTGNSNGIDFMIYDLEKLLKSQQNTEEKRKELKSITEKSQGILRAELWFTSSKSVQNFTTETIASEQIAELLKNSEEIFFTTVMRIIPVGDFYKKDKAIEVIQKKLRTELCDEK